MEASPSQYQAFCAANPVDCVLAGEGVLPWTIELAQMIDAVNRSVNAEIRLEPDLERTGIEDIWCYPDAGVGDCEDFALEKRSRLVAQGLPGAALTLAIVHHHELFFAHAVLLVETSAGTFVLDNLESSVRCWRETPYRYERRETPDGLWIRYQPTR